MFEIYSIYVKSVLESGFQKSKRNINNLKKSFQEVERNVHALITEELKIVRNMLFPAYPACSESEVKDEDKQDSVKRAVLKITLHVLRNMELHDQANTLQSSKSAL